VIVTTKRGAYGKSQISVDASYGFQEVAHKLDMMNSKQYADYVVDGGTMPGFMQVEKRRMPMN
jgi:hypothetical protein